MDLQPYYMSLVTKPLPYYMGLVTKPLLTTPTHGVTNKLKSRQGVGCRVWGVGCGVWGVGCGVWGVGCRVWGVGCGVWGVGIGGLGDWGIGELGG